MGLPSLRMMPTILTPSFCVTPDQPGERPHGFRPCALRHGLGHRIRVILVVGKMLTNARRLSTRRVRREVLKNSSFLHLIDEVTVEFCYVKCDEWVQYVFNSFSKNKNYNTIYLFIFILENQFCFVCIFLKLHRNFGVLYYIPFFGPFVNIPVMADYDVIVIGAGIAGLTAADALLKKKPDLKVLILEAAGKILTF